MGGVFALPNHPSVMPHNRRPNGHAMRFPRRTGLFSPVHWQENSIINSLRYVDFAD